MPEEVSDPNELVELVEHHAPLMKHPQMDGHLAAEEMVRWSYDLPDLTAKARERTWLERARDLVRDGWQKLKALVWAPEPPEEFDPLDGLPVIHLSNPLTAMAEESTREEAAKRRAQMEDEQKQQRQAAGATQQTHKQPKVERGF